MLVAASAMAGPAAEKPRRGGTFKIGAWTEPEHLNPILVQSGLEREIARLIFLDVAFFDDKTNWTTPLLEVFPSIANGGISKDGRTWTLKVKKGIRWHDGVAVTSADFAFSFKAATDPKVEFPAKQDLEVVASVETPDDYTVVYHLKRRSGTLHEYVPPVVPAHILSKEADFGHAAYNQMPVGNGPFEIQEWKRGSHIVLRRRHDAPPDGPPWLDKVIFKFVPDENARWVEMRSGGIDMHRTSNLDVLASAKEAKGMRIVPVINTNWTNLGFNLKSPAVSDRRVREAFVRAIDKVGIAAKVTRQRPVVIYGLAAPAARYYSDDVPKFPYDPVRAGALLDEAGWKLGKNGMREKEGKKLVIRLTTLSGSKPWQDLQVIFQDSLKHVGVTLTLENYPGNKFYGSSDSGGILNSGDFDIALMAWGGYSPYVMGRQLYHSTACPPSGSNYGRYANAEVDRLLEEAEADPDPLVQAKLSAKAQRQVIADLAVFPLYVYDSAHVLRDTVRGYSPGPFSTYAWNSADWWLAE